MPVASPFSHWSDDCVACGLRCRSREDSPENRPPTGREGRFGQENQGAPAEAAGAGSDRRPVCRCFNPYGASKAFGVKRAWCENTNTPFSRVFALFDRRAARLANRV